MTRYLISFDDGAMTFPKEDLPDVAKAAHEVVQDAQDAGVWVSGGGVKGHEVSVVATDACASVYFIRVPGAGKSTPRPSLPGSLGMRPRH